MARAPAHQHQGGPAVDVEPALQRQWAIGGDYGVGLRRQDAGEHDAAARSGQAPQWRRHALERPEQNVGKDQIEGCPRTDRPRTRCYYERARAI